MCNSVLRNNVVQGFSLASYNYSSEYISLPHYTIMWEANKAQVGLPHCTQSILLPLLPSGPDGVHNSLLRKTQPENDLKANS